MDRYTIYYGGDKIKLMLLLFKGLTIELVTYRKNTDESHLTGKYTSKTYQDKPREAL